MTARARPGAGAQRRLPDDTAPGVRTGRHFLYNLLGAGAPLLIALAAVPTIGRVAGYPRLGFLTIAWAAIGYLGVLDFGLSRVFARRIAIAAASGELAAEVVFLRWLAVRLFAWCVAGALLAAFLVPARWLAGTDASSAWLEEVRQAWWLLCASLPALVLSNLWRGAMEGREAFGPVNALRVFMGAWTFGAPLLAVFLAPTLPAMVGGIVAGRWLTYGLHRLWCRRHLLGQAAVPTRAPVHAPVRAQAERAAALRHALAEGAAITVSGVISPLMVIFDRFVLGWLAPLGTVAVYAIAQEIALRLLQVPALLASVMYPRLAVLAHAQDAVGAALVDRATRVAVLLQLPAVMALAFGAEPLLSLWLGSAVAAQAAPILRWLLAGCLLNTAAQVPFAHLQASGRSWLTARFHVAQLPFYVLFLYGAATRYGALGAAWVWSARCAVDAIMLLAATAHFERAAVSARSLAALGAALVAALCAAVGGEGGPMSGAWPWTLGAVTAIFSAAIVLQGNEWSELLQRLRAVCAVRRPS